MWMFLPGRHAAAVGVDRGHLGGDMRNAGRAEHVAERDAAGAQISLIVANPDIMKRFVAHHHDVDRCLI